MSAKPAPHEMSSAVEDYAKAIYALERRGEGAVSTNALAERLGVTPASASGMVKRLDEMEAGARGTFVRVSDSDPEMLRYLAERGIAPGERFEVIDKQPFDGPLFARFGGEDVHVLGGALARAMRVEVER